MKKILAATVFLWFAAQTGQAQLVLSPVNDYINKTTLLNNILSNKRATDMSQRKMNGKSGSAGNSKMATTKADLQPTVFKNSASILPQTLAAKANGADARFFESLLDIYRQTAAKDGFPANDLAYAAEYFIVNNYHIYHDLMDVPYEKDPRAKRGSNSFDRLTLMSQKKQLMVTLPEERAIYNQFREILGTNPAVAKMTDRQKQETTEMLAITFGLAYTGYMKGIDDEDERTTEQARQLAKQGLEKLLGVSISQIKITNTGLQL